VGSTGSDTDELTEKVSFQTAFKGVNGGGERGSPFQTVGAK